MPKNKKAGGSSTPAPRDNERDLEQALEEHRRRIFNAPTEAERKKAEKELAEHIARPGLTDDIEQLARDFEIRLKRAFAIALAPDTPKEYKEAFGPFLEKMAAIPPFDKWKILSWELTTQHMVQFLFNYGVEPLEALLCLKVWGLLSPSPEAFTAITDDLDDIERARKTREVVERIEADVVRCVQRALEHFVEALRGRLGSVLDETLSEIALRAIEELAPELNNAGEKDATNLRRLILKEWEKVEKVRIGTPAPGAPALTKEEFEALIDEAQAKLKPLRMDQTKSAVLKYINANYPAVRCGSGYHLNRLLKKYGLEGKFSKN